MIYISHQLWPRQLKNGHVFPVKPEGGPLPPPSEMLLIFNADAARFLMSEHTTCGQEITPSPNPPPGWTTIIPTVLATSRGGTQGNLYGAAELKGTKGLTLD